MYLRNIANLQNKILYSTNLLPIYGIIIDNYYYAFSLRNIYFWRILVKDKICQARVWTAPFFQKWKFPISYVDIICSQQNQFTGWCSCTSVAAHEFLTDHVALNSDLYLWEPQFDFQSEYWLILINFSWFLFVPPG